MMATNEGWKLWNMSHKTNKLQLKMQSFDEQKILLFIADSVHISIFRFDVGSNQWLLPALAEEPAYEPAPVQ